MGESLVFLVQWQLTVYSCSDRKQGVERVMLRKNSRAYTKAESLPPACEPLSPSIIGTRPATSSHLESDVLKAIPPVQDATRHIKRGFSICPLLAWDLRSIDHRQRSISDFHLISISTITTCQILKRYKLVHHCALALIHEKYFSTL